MGKFLFWLLWAAELVLFIALGGCVVLLLNTGSGIQSKQALLYLIFLVTGIAMCAGLVLARKAMLRGDEPLQLVLYLAIPLIAAFLGFGGCLITIQ